MKLKGDKLKLTMLISFVIVLMILGMNYTNKRETKFNQFINSYEGKSLVIYSLFDLEGINGATIEKHIRLNRRLILNRDLDADYKIEKIIQYALKELRISEDEIYTLISLVDTPPKINLSRTFTPGFHQEYYYATNLDEKIAMIGVALEMDFTVWNK